jgi:hypothetical protein
VLLVRVQNEPKVANGNFRFEGEVIGVVNKQNLKQSSGKILISMEADSIGKFVPAYGDILLNSCRLPRFGSSLQSGRV